MFPPFFMGNVMPDQEYPAFFAPPGRYSLASSKIRSISEALWA